MQNTVIV